MKRKKPELEIQKVLVKYLKQLEDDSIIRKFYATINEDSYMNGGAVAQGLQKGAPDMTIVLGDGYTLFLELKADKGVVSQWQKQFDQKINHLINEYSSYKIVKGLENTFEVVNYEVEKHRIAGRNFKYNHKLL